MKYYKISCSNGYCGCDEDFYTKISEDEDVAEVAEEILFNEYGFSEPDGRFIDGKSWGDEITDEEYDEYLQSLSVDWVEVTKEEYKMKIK